MFRGVSLKAKFISGLIVLVLISSFCLYRLDHLNSIPTIPSNFSWINKAEIYVLGLALEPKILIADEPTTALDVTTQAQILKLISDMQARHQTGVIFITHDFGVVADIANRVAVMQHGLLVETGKVGKDVTIELRRGETLGIVGESGSGKSTLARCIIWLLDSDSGKIILDGVDLCHLNRAEMRPWRTKIQMIFQDPFASLNPRIKVGQIIAQGPMIQGAHRADAESRAHSLLDIVGLDKRSFNRYSHEF